MHAINSASILADHTQQEPIVVTARLQPWEDSPLIVSYQACLSSMRPGVHGSIDLLFKTLGGLDDDS